MLEKLKINGIGRYFIVAIIWFSVSAGCTVKLNAQEKDDRVFLTLEEAISTALKNNNMIKSSEYSLKKASWDVKHAWSMWMPQLNLNSRFMKIDEQSYFERDFFRQNIHLFFPDLPDDFEIPQSSYLESYYTSLDVTMPVFNSSILTNITVANTGEEMASFMNKSTRENVIFQVVNTYMNVLKADAVVDLQKEYLELSKLNYEKAERMQKADRYSKSEALRWKVDYQTQKGTLVNSESMLRSGNIALYRLLNMDMGTDVEVVGQISKRLLEESDKLSGMSDQEILSLINLSEDELLKSNSSLAATRANAEMSEEMHTGSYLSYLPNVSLSYSHGWRENGTLALDDYSPTNFMVNFQMPLFSGFQNITNVKSTYYEYKKSQEDYADQMKNTRYLLTETVNKLLNLKTQKELSKTNVEFTEHNYKIVETQKERGLVSNIDFIDAKLNLQNAKLTDIHNHYDFIIAMVELYYMLGKIESLVE